MRHEGSDNTGRAHKSLFWRAGEQHTARVGDWKLVQARGQAPMLFDLAKDIGEQEDRATREPAKSKEVQAACDAWDNQMVPAKWRRSEAAPAASSAPARGQRAGTLRQRLESLDRNGDGKLSRDELPRREAFDRLDANRDGLVTPEEARAGLSRRR